MEMKVRMNKIDTQDDLLQLTSGDEYSFLDFNEFQSAYIGKYEVFGEQYLMNTVISLSNESVTHTRTIYSLLAMAGDFGGLMEVLLILS